MVEVAAMDITNKGYHFCEPLDVAKMISQKACTLAGMSSSPPDTGTLPSMDDVRAGGHCTVRSVEAYLGALETMHVLPNQQNTFQLFVIVKGLEQYTCPLAIWEIYDKKEHKQGGKGPPPNCVWTKQFIHVLKRISAFL